MSKRIIEVVEYTPQWASQFNHEKTVIMDALGARNIQAIHHIGSTSVPGLCAKPIIDILMVVKSLDELDCYQRLMSNIGYRAKGENGISGRRYFQKGGDNRSHHLHAFLAGSTSIASHLAFRDYLRAHPEIMSAYAALKQQGAAVCNNNSVDYQSHKNDFVADHTTRAVRWASSLRQGEISE